MLATEQPKMTISERRATYPLQERLKIYNPDTMAKKLNKQEKPSKLVVHGVNILNKKSVDSDTAMDRIQQRRKTHNRVEKRRRSNMNTLLNQLADLVPQSALEQKDGEKCHRAKILKYAIEYIYTIRQENQELHEKLNMSSSSIMPASPNSCEEEL